MILNDDDDDIPAAAEFFRLQITQTVYLTHKIVELEKYTELYP